MKNLFPALLITLNLQAQRSSGSISETKPCFLSSSMIIFIAWPLSDSGIKARSSAFEFRQSFLPVWYKYSGKQ